MKDRIRQLMEAQHMNQQAFARFTNIGSASLSSIFTGRTRPTMNHVTAIMEAFPHVNPKWLIQGVGPMMTNGDDENPSAALSAHGSQNSSEDSSPTSLLVEPAISTERPQGSQGSLFNENSFMEPAPAKKERPSAFEGRNITSQRSQMVRPQAADNMSVNIQASRSGHITEIRVFFDDQTWESFVPKK